MAKLTTLHDIFNNNIKKIIIPIIQRDYAQGRPGADIERIREKFLQALYDAVTQEPIILDFIYGDIDDNGVMTPLDGQQRLTTLFLLYWYAARKANIQDEDFNFLKNFSYETRYSARNFCSKLIEFNPDFEDKLSQEIINQAWFPLDWKKDPTISSMLVMLDEIDNKFKNVQDIYNTLKAGAIKFYFLPIKDMGLTDELYIKMNSRGKPLTKFENFKAELERCISCADAETAKRIISKIDLAWTDLLWQYKNSSRDIIIDDKFLRYFKFICGVICWQNNESTQGKSFDEFDLLKEYFTVNNKDKENNKELIIKNIKIIEKYFDCWLNINPKEFLNSCIAHKHDGKSIVIDKKNKRDIFEDCMLSYGDGSFSLNKAVLLYAVTSYLLNKNNININNFLKRLRIVNNLIQNSASELRDTRNDNRMPEILRQVDSIILKGEINDNLRNNFNSNQLDEERAKQKFLDAHPDKAELVFKLEDHAMLQGQISIININNLEQNINYAGRFEELFKCDWDLVDCALMAMGDYGQQEKNKWRWQYGSSAYSSAWYNLFHKSANKGFDNTSKVLIELLSSSEKFNNNILTKIISEFLLSREKLSRYDWQYYYVKYQSFRPGSYGKYNKEGAGAYMFTVMQTRDRVSWSSYTPYLKEADAAHLDKYSNGQRLVYRDKYITCTNSSYILIDSTTNATINELKINQADGIDTEDRIIALKNFIKQINL